MALCIHGKTILLILLRLLTCHHTSADIYVSALFFFTYENVLCPFQFYFFSEFGQMHIKDFQKLEGSDSLVFKILTSA